MFPTAINLIVGIAALITILDYFGVKPGQWTALGLVMPSSQKWKLVVMLGLVTVSLAMSSYGFYQSLCATGIHWKQPLPPLVVVTGKTFMNEKVPIDGFEYRSCIFRNMTFVYNGTSIFSFHDNTLRRQLSSVYGE